MNPADTLYDPRFDSMERKKQLDAAMRLVMRMYGPGAYLKGPTGSPLDCIAHIYHKHALDIPDVLATLNNEEQP